MDSQGVCGVEREQAVDGCPGVFDDLPAGLWDIHVGVVDNQPSELVISILEQRDFNERISQRRRQSSPVVKWSTGVAHWEVISKWLTPHSA